MRARYFRMRFGNNGKGIYHTLAYRDEFEKASVHLAYIGEGGQEGLAIRYPMDVLVVADLEDETLRQVEELLEKHEVRQMYLPAGTESLVISKQLAAKAGKLQFLREGESHEWRTGLWEFHIRNLGNSLSLYHGYTGTKALGEDCAFAGKIYDPEDHCSPCLIEEKDFCGFGCLHRRDFQTLKAHLDKKFEGYRTGTLLLGKGVFDGNVKELLDNMNGFKERIRIIQLPAHIQCWEKELFNLAPEKEIQYYVGHSAYSSEVPGDIASHSGYCHFVPVDLESGLCLSGYFIPFLTKKDC